MVVVGPEGTLINAISNVGRTIHWGVFLCKPDALVGSPTTLCVGGKRKGRRSLSYTAPVEKLDSRPIGPNQGAERF